ncbi:hypothetical protein BCEP4_2660007 [Burkholderia cepacia]|nr:hypothetical protein BCEP4_2660007 [Burkholderia cepacia]
MHKFLFSRLRLFAVTDQHLSKRLTPSVYLTNPCFKSMNYVVCADEIFGYDFRYQSVFSVVSTSKAMPQR